MHACTFLFCRCAHLTKTKIDTGEYNLVNLDGTIFFFPNHGDIQSKIKRIATAAGAHGSDKLLMKQLQKIL